MRSRSYRRWRVAFWGGLVVALVLTEACILSARRGVWYISESQKYGVCIYRGVVGFDLFRDQGYHYRSPGWHITPIMMDYRPWRPVVGSGPGEWSVRVPVRILALPPAAVSVVSWCRARSQRRAGFCEQCGYSLSGLPAGAPCPECGHAAPT